ncbi:methyltransferase domain-containing protein [Nocardiopsis gilva]|nr:methyltransferase domain-containing protein [Nocardiopsis gilva]
MLQALNVTGGETALEIGTATGYNCALLCRRLGDKAVTSVEVDAALAQQAREKLSAAGYEPRLVVSDGAVPVEGGPFDRILATVAAKSIPAAWITQLAPDGMLVTPWGSDHAGHWLVRLTADGTGAAHGRILDEAPFMWLRSQRSHFGTWRDHVDVDAPMQAGRTKLDPRAALGADGSGRAIVIGTLVPDLYQRVIREGDEFTVWVYDAAGSWAAADYVPGASEWVQSRYGPRDIWAEIEAAYAVWESAGRPEGDRIGLTVTADEHRLWVDAPSRVIGEGLP